MVMDATQPQQPSPQSVGREFVRQYYTLLNKAPNHLHRFYNNNSSFIHGELNLVVGQKNIHNRIQQLNFHDCHAKISQVDAQATLGNGVVVQVTGELSNDGQPMRRFTQTFVLAAQSPKKYYVHNDIFRYQDMYSEEENDGETRSEHEEEHDAQQQQQGVAGNVVVAAGDQQPQQVEVPAATAAVQAQIPGQVVNSTASAAGILQPQAPQDGGRPTIYYSVLAPQSAGAVPMGAQFQAAAGQPVQAQLNGVVAHEDLMAAGAAGMQPGSAPLVAQATSPVVPVAAALIPAQGHLAAVPVPSAALVPTAAAPMPGFQQQQSPNLMQQPHIMQELPTRLQQQPQQAPQQQPQQQAQTQQTPQPAANIVASSVVDLEEVSSGVSMDNATARSMGGQELSPNAVSSAAVAAAAPIVDDFKTINEQQQQEKYEAAKQQQQQQNEPKTYAYLLKSTSSSPSGFVNAANQQQQQLQQQQNQQQQSSNSNIYGGSAVSSSISSTTFSQQSNSTSSISNYNNRGSSANNNNANASDSMRMDNTNSTGGGNGGNGSGGLGGAPLPQRTNSKPGYNKDFERRPSNSQQFFDNQQLFLGNIPHHATEVELGKVFAPFGEIIELRILSKPYIGIGVRNPLNYGFITYADAESVQQCLKNLPLYFPANSPDGQKLNVEEKKPRQQRPNDMAPRQSMGGNMNNNMNNSQRNMSGGPPSRSLSNSGGGGGMMRGNNPNSNNKPRGGSAGGPRLGGGFNRNDNRSGPGGANGGGPQGVRGNSNNNAQSGGSSYVPRR